VKIRTLRRQRTVRRVERESDAQRFGRYHRLSDKAWLRVLLDSVDGSAALPMPGFPPAEFQEVFVGSSDRSAILEAWRFYMLMASQRAKFGLTLTTDSNVLDFGCGWGRIARMFLRDVPAANICCADTSDVALDVCRTTGLRAHLVRLPQTPPSLLPPAHFDTAFAYSVFSHLSPEPHSAWAGGLARVMKPGGLAFITTQGRWFIDRCARSFADHGDALARYDRGEFLYAPGSPPLVDGYGDAVVPRGYFESKWGQNFEVLDFIADQSRCPQAVAVLRRRG